MIKKTGKIIKERQLNVDLWGPKTIRKKNGRAYNIHVMKMVVPMMDWFKLVQLKGKPDACVYQKCFNSALLACYPHLREIGFNMRESLWLNFQYCVTIWALKSVWYHLAILNQMQS